jgi:hypothetical protein
VRRGLLRLLMLLLASYGLLYFSYRNYSPDGGGVDFYSYYPVYLHPLDFGAAPAPFVLRQLSALLTHAIHGTGTHWPGAIRFVHAGIDQSWFFSALLANYLCLLAAAWVAGRAVEVVASSTEPVFPWLAGLLCLLSFHSQSVVITGLTEGPSWLLAAGCLLAWLERRRWLLSLLLLLAVLQRETLDVAFAGIAACALLFQPSSRRFAVWILIWALLCFACYLLIRTVAGVSGSEEQLDPATLASALGRFRVTGPILLQGLLSQNMMFLCVLCCALAWQRRPDLHFWLPVLLFVTAELWLMAIAAGTGTNVGRICGVLTPLFATWTAVALRALSAETASGREVRVQRAEVSG